MDFALKYLDFVPLYFRDLVAFIAAPKTFLTDRAAQASSEDAWPRCLRFLAISAVTSYILKLGIKIEPLAQNGNFTNFAVSMMIIGFGFCFMIAAAKLSWRAVGKNIPLEALSQTQIYIFSIAMLLGNILAMISFGLGLLLFPDAYLGFLKIIGHHTIAEVKGGLAQDDVRDFARKVPLHTLLKFQQYNRAAMAVHTACLVSWFVLTWGTFRYQLQTSRWRSTGAFAIYLPLCFVIVAFFMMTLASVRGS